MMRKLMMVLFVLISYVNVNAQCDPITDSIAPTFELPMYLTEGIIYPCLDSVPPLTNMTDGAVMDLVFATMEDNCLSPNNAPWYGPTLSAGVLMATETSITYTFTASDDHPNYNSQSMTFYFESGECTLIPDTIAPEIICPDDVAQSTDTLQCSAFVIDWTNAVATDNSGWTSTPTNDLTNSDSYSWVYNVGSHLLTWSTTDSAGNTATCTQDIIIFDDEHPTIICPDDIFQMVDFGTDSLELDLDIPEVWDNCQVAAIFLDYGLNAYPIGTTMVTWGVSDGTYNVFCNQNITIQEDSTLYLGVNTYQEEEIIIYPNPSNGEFTITTDKEYQILDYLGRVQDPNNLESGIYYIRIENIILNNKLIISK